MRALDPVPPLPPVPLSDPSPSEVQAEELDIYEQDGKKLDLQLRRWTAFGAIGVAGLMYGVGICICWKTFFPKSVLPPEVIPSWHTVVATLLALFAVPTVLVLAVLRSSSFATKDVQADSLHALIGTKLMSLIDKLIDKIADKTVN